MLGTGFRNSRYWILILAASIAILFWFIKFELPSRKPTLFTEVRLQDLPGPLLPERPERLQQALDRSIAFLATRADNERMHFGKDTIPVPAMRQALLRLKRCIGHGMAPGELHEVIQKTFRIYRLNNHVEGFHVKRGSLLVTGYFEPEIKASPRRTNHYPYPVYGIPADLVRINLREFDDTLPDRVLWGRINGHNMVPYYTRWEIDYRNPLKNTPVLAWLKSPVDGLLLHIQGSGILEFPDGSKRFIHYAASNGRPYHSMGRWLIDKGILKPSDAHWPGIRRWAERHPEQFQEACRINPRYIFFRWEEHGPVGKTGQVLVPMTSVALDQGIYPLGGLYFLDIPAPADTSDVQEGLQSFSGLVLSQDTGGAIKGPYRLDLYCGTGEKAGKIASTLKRPGELFVFVPRESNTDKK